MSVYFGRMNNEEQLQNLICKGYVGSGEKYFGGIQPNDYVFIRLERDQANVSRLWKFSNFITDAENTTTAQFQEVFEFNQISINQLVRLNFFKITTKSVIFTKRSMRGVGFFKLDLINETEFTNAIVNQTTFNTYLGNQTNYRNIEIVSDNNALQSSVNVQLIKENETYKLYNSDQSFLGDLVFKFKPDRYNKFKQFLLDNPEIANNSRKRAIQKRVKAWLESNGINDTIELIDLWDFFCSENDFVNNEITEQNEKDDKQDADQEDNIIYADDKNLLDILKGYIQDDYKQIILTGAPGTGKTYSVKSFTGNGDNVKFVQFHPSYDYSDFVEGLRPVMISNKETPTFVRVDGVFKKFCRKVVENDVNIFSFKKICGKIIQMRNM